MKRIIAKYRWGEKISFPIGVFEVLVADPEVEWIRDADTGEILYYCELVVI